MPSSWAVVMTSVHWSTEMRPGEMRSRISWSRISAEVPGRLPTPACCKACRYSRMVQRERTEP